MLGMHKEEDWKNDSGKRFEKFIFRTIDTSSKIENIHEYNKPEEKIIQSSTNTSKKLNQDFFNQKKNKKRQKLNSKKKNIENKPEDTVYELLALTEKEILLQKKKLRQVKFFLILILIPKFK
jgi:hypothetical protein